MSEQQMQLEYQRASGDVRVLAAERDDVLRPTAST